MRPLQVLVVEDSPEDSMLVALELRRGGFWPELHRVETEEELRQALVQDGWDVVLSDYFLPLLEAPRVLQVIQEMGKDIPVIVISGGAGEKEGVEVMRAGARDYFPKDRITRLAAAVTRELAEAEARRARARARAELERVLLARVGEVRFERAVSSRSEGGLGLGLYLSRRVAEAHGGRVWAQEREGGGATFILELPLESAEVHS